MELPLRGNDLLNFAFCVLIFDFPRFFSPLVRPTASSKKPRKMCEKGKKQASISREIW
jgi:hypothetical protein